MLLLLLLACLSVSRANAVYSRSLYSTIYYIYICKKNKNKKMWYKLCLLIIIIIIIIIIIREYIAIVH